MKAKIKIEREIDFTHLILKVQPRYWEDTEVNGIDDTLGKLIPLRSGENWSIKIDLKSGLIYDWCKGKTAKVHYKVCDSGLYYLLDVDNERHHYKGYYVPDILDITGDSFGDYLIFNIDENGYIENWKCTEQDIQKFIDYGDNR